ncbi:MAG: hypothetical protein U0074_00130 [Kouleothrix sp.]
MFQVDSLYQRYPALRSAMLILMLPLWFGLGMLGLIMLGQVFLWLRQLFSPRCLPWRFW